MNRPTKMRVEALAGNGKIWFVEWPHPLGVPKSSDLLPGDIVRPIRWAREERSLLEIEVLKHSPRTNGRCDVLRDCGGCPLMAIDRNFGIESKRAWVRREFAARQLSTKLVDEAPFFVGDGFDYRRRLRLKVERGRLRFFNPNKSFDCVVVEPSVREGIAELDRALATCDFRQLLSWIEVRGRDADERIGVMFFSTTNVDYARIQAWMIRELPSWSWALATKETVMSSGAPRVNLSGDLWASVPLTSFLQINEEANRALLDFARCGAKKRRLRRFVDLFCGAGNFAFLLASAGLEGVGVEIDERATRVATLAANEQGLNLEFYAADAREVAFESELWVLDPPRAGVQNALVLIKAHRPNFLLLVSCNPSTLAADILELKKLGYVLEEGALFDMFPHTAHLESAWWLRLNDESEI